MNIEIKKSLSVLELGDLARIIEMQEKDIKLVDLSYEKRLELLLETLIQERENRLINRLIKNAYFKYPSASIESLDYDARQIKKSTILNLATMGFVANATNLVITGPTGAGKTYLACALGVEACRQTYRVLYIRMPDLMRNFENQNDNLRELTKYRKRIGNYQILILDEWLNYKLTEKDAKNLYELFEQRSGNNSTIFVGQYPVDEWHNRLGGGTQADSIMDRIIHNAYEIPPCRLCGFAGWWFHQLHVPAIFFPRLLSRYAISCPHVRCCMPFSFFLQSELSRLLPAMLLDH